MKVEISCLGRFHAFHLARELAERGALARLHTSYPPRLAVRAGIPPFRVRGNVLFEGVNRATQRLERRAGVLDARGLPARAFDRWVAAGLRSDFDLFLGWSGSCRRSLERARELGALTLVERGSSHILHQEEVLRDEYERVGHRGRLPAPAVRAAELEEYERADHVVVPTAFARRTFLERGFAPERVLQVPYGVDLSAFHPPERPAPGKLRLLQVGNASLRKGVHLLLEAHRRLGRDDVELHFVGAVPPEIRPFARRFAGRGVCFHGRVPQDELLAHYHRAHLFCLPSLEEGMAMVIPQAMAAGLPVLATEESGAGEVVRPGRDGWFVPAGSVEALVEALERLVADREALAGAGREAAARVSHGFGWGDYGTRIHAAYTGALRARDRRETAA